MGLEAADRYNDLIFTAIAVVGESPDTPGSRQLPRIPGVRAYDPRLARRLVPPERRVGRPRHVLVYRVAPDGVVEILTVAHDRMLLSRAARQALRAARDS